MYYPAGAEFYSSESEDDFYPTPANASSVRGSGGGWTPSAAPWNNSNTPAAQNNNNNLRQDVKMDNPDMEKILERTKKSIRSVLMAEKDQVALSMLEKEYYDMYEETIPWRRLQFSNLEEFLRSIPSVCRVTNIGFSTFVAAVTDQNTQHIRQMVAYTKRPKKKGKGKKGGGFAPSYGYGYQSYRPPPPPPKTTSNSNRGGDYLANQSIKERTEKLIKSTLNTSREPMSFTMLEKEFMKFYQEEIPWRRLGFTSLEKFLRTLPGICKVSGSTVSSVPSPSSVKSRVPSRPAPAAEKKEEEKKVEKKRLPETSEQSVWVGRMRTFLSGRKFGLLLSQAEKLYEKDWSESLPLDWKVKLGSIPDIVIRDDGVAPPILKLSPESAPASVKPASRGAALNGGDSLAGQVTGMNICEEPKPSASDVEVPVERMGDIVKIRPKGLFMSQAQKIYLKQWEEVFPTDLWTVMEETKLVSINTELKIVKWI